MIENTQWYKYQKAIPDGPFFYVRSCIRQTFNIGAENILPRILTENLGIKIYEDQRHTCCSGIAYHSDLVPIETSMTIIARQFSLMTELGYEYLLVSCVTSFGMYNEVLDIWQHFPEKLQETRDNLFKATGRTFEIPKSIIHTSDIIYKYRNEIAEQIKYRLINNETGEPLNVADHVGCHYAKIFPTKGVGGAEFPQVLSGLAEPWGGRWIDYTERRHCCGFGFRHYLLQENRGYSVTHSKIKFESLKPHNADLIITNCPGCNMFLDRWQYTIAEMEGRTYDKFGKGIPVLSYEELAALLLGYDPWDIGLQTHQVQVESLMDKIGIPYNTSKKYLGENDAYIGKPEQPENLVVR